MSLTKEIKILEEHQKLVEANKLLAEMLEQNFDDPLNAPFFKITKKGTKLIFEFESFCLYYLSFLLVFKKKSLDNWFYFF